MANPPITIGPFNNVPAPGSPIASNWAQSISQWITTSAMDSAGATTATATTLSSTEQILTSTIYLAPRAVASRGLILAQVDVQVAAAPAFIAMTIYTNNDAVVSTASAVITAAARQTIVLIGLSTLPVNEQRGFNLRGRLGSGSGGASVPAASATIIAVGLR